MKGGKGAGGTRKCGRAIAKCAQYKSENRRLKNKASRIAKRLRGYKRQPPKMLRGFSPELKSMVMERL